MRLLLHSIFVVLVFVSAGADAAGKTTQHELQVGNITRQYMVYRPASVPRSDVAKTVLAFHGFMSDPAGLRWLTKPDKWADKHGYLMIYPKAIKGSFNAGKGSGSAKSNINDLAFIDALVTRALTLHKTDATRLYAIGFSNGAQMAALLMCKRARLLAGMAMVAHSLNIANCKPEVPVPVTLIRGAKDPFVPFTGGGRHGLKSHVATVNTIAGFHNLATKTNEVSLNLATIRCRDYPNRSRSKLRSCVGFADGHTWPGGTKFQAEKFGRTNTDVNGYELIFKFFDRQKALTALRSPVSAKPSRAAAVSKAQGPKKVQTPKPKMAAKTPKTQESRSQLRYSTRGQISIPVDLEDHDTTSATSNKRAPEMVWYAPRG